MSRAEVARHAGISAPTASKAIETLLRAGLLEEGDAALQARGRPARKLRLATRTAQVLGLVIDASVCSIVSAGLDGEVFNASTAEIDTPGSYEELLDRVTVIARGIMERAGVATLGIGICLPGLMDYKAQRGLLSPNVPITNGRSPGRDIADLLGIECVMVQESHALCLAERQFGLAKGLNDFAMLDVGTGIGLGVMSGGRLLAGHSGLAGEIGHMTVALEGRLCGCGNSGCLETVASDSAFAWHLSRRTGRNIHVSEAIEIAKAGHPEARKELDRICRYLGIGVAMVINLFNPSTLFIHGKLFDADPTLLPRVVEEAGRRALTPSFADCKVVRAQGSKRQGATAAIIEHLTNVLAPSFVIHNHAYPVRAAVRVQR